MQVFSSLFDNGTLDLQKIYHYLSGNYSSPPPPTMLQWHAGSLFPDQGSNPYLLQCKHGVLTTGPPEKSQRKTSEQSFSNCNLFMAHLALFLKCGFNSVGPGWGLRFFMSKFFPVDSKATGPQTTISVAKLHRSSLGNAGVCSASISVFMYKLPFISPLF